MPNRTNAATIDLDFSPRSYWEHSDPTSAILQNIKGQVRREMVRDFIAGTAPARLGPIEPELLEDEVDNHTRAFLGRIHPRWIRGEQKAKRRDLLDETESCLYHMIHESRLVLSVPPLCRYARLKLAAHTMRLCRSPLVR